MPLMRFLAAALLLWNPGFSEHTAYTLLLVGFAINAAFVVIQSLVVDGVAHAFVLAAFVIPILIVVWNQPWFEEHTVLYANFILAAIVLGLNFLLSILAAADPMPRTRARARANGFRV